MKPLAIQGLNLKIDPAIQEICSVSNITSKNTRSVLYVLVIISIVALASVINTYPYNWSQERLTIYRNKLDVLRVRLHEQQINNNADSIQIYSDLIDLQKRIIEAKIRSTIENYQTVKIPIIGNVFDVNYLSLIAGISFIILLVVIRFLFIREVNNLIICLNSITERYSDNANEEDFLDYLESKKNDDRVHVLYSINYTRRKYHYNFLSMNEVFNPPPLKISGTEIINSANGKCFVNRLFWFPFIVFLFIILNDLSTLQVGIDWYTKVSSFTSLLLGLIIFLLCLSCVKCKRILFKSYRDFKSNDYKYINEE